MIKNDYPKISPSGRAPRRDTAVICRGTCGHVPAKIEKHLGLCSYRWARSKRSWASGDYCNDHCCGV